MKLTRYWLEFAAPGFFSIRLFGVIAWTFEDALNILSSELLQEWESLELTRCIHNIDVRTLDLNHVLPNMGNCAIRGIWFPNGY